MQKNKTKKTEARKKKLKQKNELQNERVNQKNTNKEINFNMEQAAGCIGFHINVHKTEF